MGELADTKFELGNVKYELEGFDEEVEDEIEKIWEDCQSELDVEADRRRKELESLYEKESNEKYESLAEMKSEYNAMI